MLGFTSRSYEKAKDHSLSKYRVERGHRSYVKQLTDTQASILIKDGWTVTPVSQRIADYDKRLAKSMEKSSYGTSFVPGPHVGVHGKRKCTPASLYTHAVMYKEFNGKVFKLRPGRSDAIRDTNGNWRFPSGKTRTKPKAEATV